MYMIIRGRGNNYGNGQNNVKFASAFGIVRKKNVPNLEKSILYLFNSMFKNYFM